MYAATCRSPRHVRFVLGWVSAVDQQSVVDKFTLANALSKQRLTVVDGQKIKRVA